MADSTQWQTNMRGLPLGAASDNELFRKKDRVIVDNQQLDESGGVNMPATIRNVWGVKVDKFAAEMNFFNISQALGNNEIVLTFHRKKSKDFQGHPITGQPWEHSKTFSFILPDGYYVLPHPGGDATTSTTIGSNMLTTLLDLFWQSGQGLRWTDSVVANDSDEIAVTGGGSGVGSVVWTPDGGNYSSGYQTLGSAEYTHAEERFYFDKETVKLIMKFATYVPWETFDMMVNLTMPNTLLGITLRDVDYAMTENNNIYSPLIYPAATGMSQSWVSPSFPSVNTLKGIYLEIGQMPANAYFVKRVVFPGDTPVARSEYKKALMYIPVDTTMFSYLEKSYGLQDIIVFDDKHDISRLDVRVFTYDGRDITFHFNWTLSLDLYTL